MTIEAEISGRKMDILGPARIQIIFFSRWQQKNCTHRIFFFHALEIAHKNLPAIFRSGLWKLTGVEIQMLPTSQFLLLFCNLSFIFSWVYYDHMKLVYFHYSSFNFSRCCCWLKNRSRTTHWSLLPQHWERS